MPIVAMPDGTQVQMPDNPPPELIARLKAFQSAQSNAPLGSQVPTGGPGWGQQAPPTPKGSAVDRLLGTARDLAGGAVDTAGMLGTSMLAKPAGDIAGLGTIAGNAVGLTDRMPADVQASVQGALQGQPNSAAGASVQRGLGAFGGAVEGVGKAVGGGYTSTLNALGAPSSVSEGVGNGIAELTNQAASLLGTKLPALGKSRIVKAAQNAVDTGPTQAGIQAAKDAGYPIPPSAMLSAPVGKFAAGLGGKADVNSAFALASQKVSDRIAKADIGIPADQEFNSANIAKRDAVADAGYDAVKTADQNVIAKQVGTNAAGKPIYRAQAAGPMPPDPAYTTDIQQMGQSRAGSQLPPNPEVDALRDQLLNAQGALKPVDAVEDLKRIRAQARANLKAEDNPAKLELGQAQMQAADAMEARLERYLQPQPALYKQFTDARTLKAKLYTVKDNFNAQRGSIDASGVSAERAKTGGDKSPMSGGLKTIADAADALQNTVKNTDGVQAPAPFSALGLTAAAAAAGGGELAGHGGHGLLMTAGILGSRPALRGALLSPLYQRTLGAQTPTASLLSKMAAQPGSPLAGLAVTDQTN